MAYQSTNLELTECLRRKYADATFSFKLYSGEFMEGKLQGVFRNHISFKQDDCGKVINVKHVRNSFMSEADRIGFNEVVVRPSGSLHPGSAPTHQPRWW